MNLENKVAIVTGGAQGLGRGFAEAVVKGGGKVCIADVQADQGEQAARELEEQYGPGAAIFVRCDVTDDIQFENVFSEVQRLFGRVDIMVNNAGVHDEDNWSRTMDINLRAVITGTKKALERMRKSTGGNGGIVVNIGSIAGYVAWPPGPVYTACKHGVVGLTRTLGASTSVAEEGVRIVCLCPSIVNTPLLQATSNRERKAEDILQVDDVVKAFLQLINDKDNQGGVMEITKRSGMSYIPPQGFLEDKN